MAEKSLYDLLKLAGEKIDSIVKSGTMTATYSGGITGTMTVPYIDFIDGTRIVWQPFNSSFNLAAEWLNCVNTTKSTITVFIMDVYKRVKSDNLRFQWLAIGEWK